MLNLPKTSEINLFLPKKALFEKCNPRAADRQRFNADIKKLVIVHEVSANTSNIAVGVEVKTFYVVLAHLKNPVCDTKNIALMSRLIDQNMIFVLEYEGKARLSVFRAGTVLLSEEKPLADWNLSLLGINLDKVWENIIAQIGGVIIAEGNTLDEQIVANDKRAKTRKRLERLEKQARTEKQPRRKWKLVERMRNEE